MLGKSICASLFVLGFVVQASAIQTTKWVNKDLPGDDVFGEGTETDPFNTISRALDFVHGSSGAFIIKVVDGDYTQAHETTFAGGGYPLEISYEDGVTIVGVNSTGNPPSATDYPRLGGDVGNTVQALIEVDATGADLSNIQISRLRFLGENETGDDSPIALQVLAANDYEADLTFEYNICSRPFQNESGGNGKATIHCELMNAEIKGYIRNNVIDASNRAAIEIVPSVQEGHATSTGDLHIDNNVISNPGGVPAAFGIRWHGLGAEDPNPHMIGLASLNANTIKGRGNALATGIEIRCEEHGDYRHLTMNQNSIDACDGDGVVLAVDGWDEGDPSLPEIAAISIDRNIITRCGGSGLVLGWDGDLEDNGAGYLHIIASHGNLIADNRGYGIEVRGFGPASTGSFTVANETIVYNTLDGEGFVDMQLGSNLVTAFSAMGWSHGNCIMYGNGTTGSDQVTGLDSVDEDLLDILFAGVHHSDWQAIPLADEEEPCLPTETAQWNIDCFPEFLDVTHRLYKLDDDPASPCIDVGDNSAAEGFVLDIDNEDRTQDGDWDCMSELIEMVDMGYDEVPQPDCPE